MYEKDLIEKLCFSLKENTTDVYSKTYTNRYTLEIDFKNEVINYGEEIKSDSKTTQNFSQPENFVVLECVDRLLTKGYPPQNIILEKTWPAGHGTSGRLDICVTCDDGSEYLLIECKTFGREFDEAKKKLQENGGQLFTYFKFSNKADVIMLYASHLQGDKVVYQNEIIPIKDDYRIGDVKDFYEKWNKLTKDNGVFENWVKLYCFENKALTIKDLVDIKLDDSSFIFNRFLEILRHNVVSDKPNAFNKIFTLFLCKIYDEKMNEDNPDNELGFQWFNAPYTYNGKQYDKDNDVSFQLRLTDLYKEGMQEFLEKKVTDISESEFDKKFAALSAFNDDLSKQIKYEINRLRLEKNNEFAIKEVYDEKSFNENAKVVKEIVELLQKYKIRYTQKQQYLSDFFELLLTTGLKQESGQFFTPLPIAQFIIRSLPIDKIINAKLSENKKNNLLPYIIDYAAGSGHFITESMNEIQKILNNIDSKMLKGDAKKLVEKSRIEQFDWALNYIYGIEKDYRLVKVGKVGCYLHGDGLANVIHSDGLAKFGHSDYKEKLQMHDADFRKENKQFDIVVSNPPYSVSAFKNAAKDYYTKDDFELYDSLTDNSSEIECLFVERTKQLLKNGGLAGIILPSSILSNSSIYTKTREIILQFFEVIAITELGSNTFMATGTNTIILFLRRRDNYDSINLDTKIGKIFETLQDGTINGIENPVAQYASHVWDLSFSDYITLLQKAPNKKAESSEIYKEYRKYLFPKISSIAPEMSSVEIAIHKKTAEQNEKRFWENVIKLEKEKLHYFILCKPQTVVLIKTGEKDAEKRFLGYEFSNRRGSEGIHPIQRGKTIDECTRLYDETSTDNPQKASTYIYRAFNGDVTSEIDASLQNNISRVRLVDMLVFDRKMFDKTISTAIKNKGQVKSKWKLNSLLQILTTLESGKRPSGGVGEYTSGTPSLGGEHIDLDGNVNLTNIKYVPNEYFDKTKQGVLQDGDILLCKDGALTGKVALFCKKDFPYARGMRNEHLFILRTAEKTTQVYLFHFLFSTAGQELLKDNVTGAAQGGLNKGNLLNIKIPLPPIDIQEKIVAEIGAVEQQEEKTSEQVNALENKIASIINTSNNGNCEIVKLENVTELISGQSPESDFYNQNKDGLPFFQGKIDFGEVYLNYPTVWTTKITKISVKNDILISVRAPVGPVNLNPFEKICIGRGLSALRVTDKILNRYLFYYLKLNQKLIKGSAGAIFPSISREQLFSINIPLPPLYEQQKIVAEIEILEAETQRLQKQQKQMKIQKEQILKKYL
jgi:type I restriction enzyme M protein